MCDAGIENPKKNVWLNKSINPLNKTFLLGKRPKTHFLRKRQNPKKNVFIILDRTAKKLAGNERREAIDFSPRFMTGVKHTGAKVVGSSATLSASSKQIYLFFCLPQPIPWEWEILPTKLPSTVP